MTRKVSILVFVTMISFAASCAKIEKMESPDETPVSYMVIKDVVHSKAGELEYDKDIPFKSSAFLLDEGKYWNSNKAEASIYIDKATISYDDVENSWHDLSKTHFWPRHGSLSFFSWSPATIADSKITVDKNNGVCLTDWNTATYPSIDFMVADAVFDKTANETSYFYNGVPTLFRHKLATVSFHAYLEKIEAGKWTKINKVYLTHIYAQADFINDDWKNWEDKKDEWVIYENAEGMALTEASQQIGASVYMIPQNLSAETGRPAPQLVIVYSNEGGNNISKTFSFGEDINSYFWAKGTKTRYSISYGTSDQPIDFDADVENWIGYGNSDVNIGDI